MAKEHEDYIRGFITYLATSPRVPEHLRDEMKQWGPAKDEFTDTAGCQNFSVGQQGRRGFLARIPHAADLLPDSARRIVQLRVADKVTKPIIASRDEHLSIGERNPQVTLARE